MEVSTEQLRFFPAQCVFCYGPRSPSTSPATSGLPLHKHVSNLFVQRQRGAAQVRSARQPTAETLERVATGCGQGVLTPLACNARAMPASVSIPLPCTSRITARVVAL